jgi:hypothetical protein
MPSTMPKRMAFKISSIFFSFSNPGFSDMIAPRGKISKGKMAVHILPGNSLQIIHPKREFSVIMVEKRNYAIWRNLYGDFCSGRGGRS